MLVRVLGSAAGGGVPQWNCACAGCAAARSGAIRARTQDSVAVSADGESWVLLNASPDIRAQIESLSELSPKRTRHSPIAGIVLTNADIDHCLGLFVLRESTPLAIHATPAVLVALRNHDALCRTLERSDEQVRWLPLVPGSAQQLSTPDGRPTGLVVEAVPVPGKLPPHLTGLVEPRPDDDVGLLIRSAHGKKTLGYAPCVAHDAPGVERVLCEADLVLFDGTFWSNDELVALGAGTRRATDMAHWPLSGPEGSLERLRKREKVFLTHINNTNPVLRDTAERNAVLALGIEIADDGLDLSL